VTRIYTNEEKADIVDSALVRLGNDFAASGNMEHAERVRKANMTLPIGSRARLFDIIKAA
jgi:hypothetical protein